jgi:hypothetical protein
MKELLETPGLANALALLGLVSTTASIFLAIYIFKKQNKIPLLVYKITAAPVIGFNHNTALGTEIGSRLNIEFDGQKVENLSVAEVWLWNAGDAVLEGNTLLRADPLRVQIAKECRILNVEPLLNPDRGCEITLSTSSEGTSCEITFLHLSPGEGILLSVMYTASSRRIGIRGALKGIKVEEYLGGLEAWERAQRRWKFSMIWFVLLLAGTFLFQEFIRPRVPEELSTSLLVIFCFITTAPVFWAILFPGYRRRRVPDKLQLPRHKEEEERAAMSDGA